MESESGTSGAKAPGFRLTEAAIVATAPVVGAVLTFAYEAGFLSWYGVPYIFVRIDATAVLLMASAAGALLFAALGYARMVPSMPWRALMCALYLALFPAVLLIVSYALISAVAWRPWSQLAWKSLLSMSFAIGAYYAAKHLLVTPIRLYKDEGDWAARWLRRMRDIGAGGDYTMEDRLHIRMNEVLGPRATGLMLAFSLSVVLMYWWGSHRAAKEVAHVIRQTGEPCVVLRRYGEGLLCAGVDTTAWRLSGGFRILPFADATIAYATVVTGPIGEQRLPVAIHKRDSVVKVP